MFFTKPFLYVAIYSYCGEHTNDHTFTNNHSVKTKASEYIKNE